MLGVLLWNIFLFAAGAITVLVSAWWWILNYESPTIEPTRPTITNSSLPGSLVDKLKQGIGLHRRETCFALNLILQFFFQEKRYEAGITRWLTNMLTLEFSELLKHRALSKFIHNMQIRDLNLGTNFPVIRAVTAKRVNLNPETSNLEQVDILVELEYNGGAQLAIDASSRFSKSAMVKIKVVHLAGNGRLQFSRYPFTHWSFSFYEEPQVEFEVYSSLGLHIPRFNAIITSQLRGVLKRKHTLPYFKLRGPPLIKRQVHPVNEEGCSVPPGRLTGEIVKCTRLQSALVEDVMYCTVMVSEVPIICAVEKPSVGICIVQDLILKRPHGSSAGILLHNADEGTPVVESVNQSSPAFAAGLRKNDVLIAVNGTYLSSSQQAAKLFSSSNINGDVDNISLRVKRIIPLEQKKQVAGEQKGANMDGGSTLVGEDACPGDMSGSGRSTPDSSHNNSPELKRKLLELHTLNVETKTWALTQDRSPIAAGIAKSLPRPVTTSNQDKSPGQCPGVQSFSSSGTNEKSERPPSNQSSKAGTPTSSELVIPSAAERRPARRHTSKIRPHIKMMHTNTIEGSTDPVFNSDFEFWLEEENKFLNVAVWSRSNGVKRVPDVETVDNKNANGKSGQKEKEREKKRSRDVEKSKLKEDKVVADVTEDTLVGYINMPVISLIPETTLNTQGHAVRILTLKPPHPKCPEVMGDPLNAHKGFDKNLCYGDIMLSLTYQPQDRCDMSLRIGQDKSSNRPLSEDESLTDGTVSEEDEMFGMQDIVEDRSHDFKRTHFQSAVQCDFCRKKARICF
ncbi:hypothetical protein SK128_011365 [Halocaridina rubra]|uniref:PDZ domain-containing protein 8 n=1 Tax=Halocaridina rubra TaxID=373956 RepID=A0AAN9A2Z7_HALRR